MLSLTTNARWPGYGTVWFDPLAMINVLSFGNIAQQYRVPAN